MEQNISGTDLRQRLTDVLQLVREQRETYIIETSGQPQAAIINLDEYRQFQQYRRERETFFDWLEDASSRNAEASRSLSQEEVLRVIEQAREEIEIAR